MAFCTGAQTTTAILKVMIPGSLQFSEGLPAGTYTFFYMHIYTYYICSYSAST